jgi:predicted RNA-binding protein with PUA-like domain
MRYAFSLAFCQIPFGELFKANSPNSARDSAHIALHPNDMQYWLVKQEPEDYSWATLEQDGRTAWTGVRNFQARNNLRAMKRGDLVFFYHSVSEKQVVGIAKVAREAYPDPTASEGDWSCVDLVPEKPLAKPVGLDAIRGDPQLKDMKLVKQSRLSVMPLTKPQFQRVLKLGETKAP